MSPLCTVIRFRTDEPVHINIIRDPINRFLSNYFFRRFGDWRGEENHVVRTPGMKDDERYLVRDLKQMFLKKAVVQAKFEKHKCRLMSTE